MLDELFEVLRIPSVSTGEPDRDGLRAAAEWYAERVRRAGGDADVVPTDTNPLVVGELRANAPDAPTVLLYAHYDVQSVGDRDLWETDPFEPVVRDGRIYARGASDNKGNSWPTVWTACELAAAGELPVNVRVFVEGEEEAGSWSAMEWIETDARGADCCIVFDSGTLDPSIPAITLGTRGIVQCLVEVRTAVRDVHSGIYGGSVHNAAHVMTRLLSAVLPDERGDVRPELAQGVQPVPEAEQATWAELPPGDLVIEMGGARAITPDAGERYHLRNGAQPSVDVTMVSGGEPRTIVPAVVRANVTMRLAPGQRHDQMRETLERLMREQVPDGVDATFSWDKGCDAAAFDAESPPLRIAREAFEAGCGRPAMLIRLGGSIPILAPLANRGIQTILSGFATPFDQIHAPNESYPLESLEQGVRVSDQLFRRLAVLPR